MENYIPLLSGFIGALIGAFASTATIFVQSRAQNKRERTRIAAQLALEDLRLHIESATKAGKGASVAPAAAYLHYHLELMKLIENDSLNPVTLRLITKKNQEIMKTINVLNKEYEQRKAKQPKP